MASMSSDDQPGSRLGKYMETPVGGEIVRSFIPPSLPPEPPLTLTPAIVTRLAEAERALGRLDGVAARLPDQPLFLYMYVRKEAVLSSQIEGTQSTLDDLLLFEMNAEAGQPVDDIREVSNYVDAMMYGLDRLSSLPLSLRLIREMHERLLREGRGGSKMPGEFRTTQNWIGGTRPGNAIYVPPPVAEMILCLDQFERFMHDETPNLPALIKAGLLHVQFESIHPFLDGNGRIGRLLVTLFLIVTGVIRQPLLYLSLYLKTHRADYYRLLQEVRERGAWEAWIEFFLDGVIEIANQAFETATGIDELFRTDRDRISLESVRAGSVLRVHEAMQTRPFISGPATRAATGLTTPTVNAALADLEKMGIVEEITGKRRGRVYAYRRYLDLLHEGA
ncbi:Fic family protein [Nisaea acidiphila]|uniref:Fic family protein n=1 Tax=Nisaea acidiphila TaxID=1862145 RepID=A0A9J7B2F7_9PROT|nr:Fic family protein [Nisaea acidiphila]UUX51845.1 Fic family protein [Nisaea acidiphila]